VTATGLSRAMEVPGGTRTWRRYWIWCLFAGFPGLVCCSQSDVWWAHAWRLLPRSSVPWARISVKGTEIEQRCGLGPRQPHLRHMRCRVQLVHPPPSLSHLRQERVLSMQSRAQGNAWLPGWSVDAGVCLCLLTVCDHRLPSASANSANKKERWPCLLVPQ
jgi:hypothetical protein